MLKEPVYGFEMARISEVYLSTLSSLMSPHGIERCFVPILYVVENSGKISQKDLATALRKDKVSTMRTVDYLCEKGLVVRKQDCNDRRCQLLEATDKAKTLIPEIQKNIQQTNNLLLEGFSESERTLFQSSMKKLYTTICALPEPDFTVEAYKRNK